jgi:hypothetical protein
VIGRLVAAVNEFVRLARLAVANAIAVEQAGLNRNQSVVAAQLTSIEQGTMHKFAFEFGKPALSHAMDIEVTGFNRVRFAPCSRLLSLSLLESRTRGT